MWAMIDMFVWQKRLGNANNSLSCGGTIYSCHIRVQTMMALNLQIMSISQDYGVHPSHVKYLIRNSCNVFSGVLFQTGCMSNVPTRSKE